MGVARAVVRAAQAMGMVAVGVVAVAVVLAVGVGVAVVDMKVRILVNRSCYAGCRCWSFAIGFL
jgi:hypothetical protein